MLLDCGLKPESLPWAITKDGTFIFPTFKQDDSRLTASELRCVLS